jgi:hypothetical protein
MPKIEAKLFFENVKYSLENIHYKILKQAPQDEEISVEIKDKFEIENLSFEQIDLIVSRTIGFHPKCMFNLIVEAKLKLPLNQDDKKFIGTQENLTKYTNDHIETIINRSNLMETISLLVSQITSSYGKVPIISPPVFVMERLNPK